MENMAITSFEELLEYCKEHSKAAMEKYAGDTLIPVTNKQIMEDHVALMERFVKGYKDMLAANVATEEYARGLMFEATLLQYDMSAIAMIGIEEQTAAREGDANAG